MANGVMLNKVYFPDLETAIKCCRDILNDMGFLEIYLSSAKWSSAEDILYREVEYSVGYVKGESENGEEEENV